MADAMEPLGEDVEQEAPDELVGSERHQLELVVVAVVAPAETYLAAGERNQPAVGDGDAMGVAAEIAQRLCGPGVGAPGIDHPVDAA